MLKSMELPDCLYPREPITIKPCSPTPNHSLYLSNLDDQKFLRFSIKYLYLFNKSLNLDTLKCSLSRVLVDYYPLAGRLKTSSDDNDHKLEVDCNGKGALFVEAFMDLTIEELIEISIVPNKSWKKLLYRVEAQSFLNVPPLIVQVTNLRCGGMILCTAISHCLCDGIGTSQFLHAWAQLTKDPNTTKLTIIPFHGRHVLKSRDPLQVKFPHPGYTKTKPISTQVELLKWMQSQPLVATSFTFGSHQILLLKKQCVPSLKCTTFETIAAHTWRSWIGSLDLCPNTIVKLLFSINIRKHMNLPQGYYGNGFVLGCAQSKVKDLISSNNNNNYYNNLYHGVKLVQEAKATTLDNDGEYIKSMIDLLEDKGVKTDLSTSLVISQWSKLGLESVDFGEGKPLHMGPLTSDVYCLFLPVIGDDNAVRVLVSVPESVVENFKNHMMVKESCENNHENNTSDVINTNNNNNTIS